MAAIDNRDAPLPHVKRPAGGHRLERWRKSRLPPPPISPPPLKGGGKGVVLLDFLDVDVFLDQLSVNRITRSRFSDAVTQHDHIISYNLFSCAFLAILSRIGPVAQSAFNVDLTALFYVLTNNFSQFAPGDNVVEVDRFLLGLGLGVLPGVIRRQAELGDCLTGSQAPRLRIPHHVPDQGNFIEVHNLILSASGSAGFSHRNRSSFPPPMLRNEDQLMLNLGY